MAMFQTVTMMAAATSAAGPVARINAVWKSAPAPPKASPQIAAAPYTKKGEAAPIVSNSAGQTWVVPVTLGAWEAAACRVAGRNLTRTEWDEFLPGRPYRRFCP